MKIFVALAGIPNQLFHEMRSFAQHSLVGDVDDLKKFKIISNEGGAHRYSAGYAREVRYWFQEIAQKLLRDSSSEGMFFVVVYVNHIDAEDFVRALSPWALTVRIENPKIRSGVESAVCRRAANELRERVANVMPKIRRTLTAVAHELGAVRNRTPTLLPFNNFNSAAWKEKFARLAAELGNEEDASSRLLAFRGEMAKRYWRKISTDTRSYFVDDKGVVYRVPAPRAYHAMAHLNGGEHSDCFIRGNIRLGGRYPAAFHYDCQFEGGGRFSGNLPSCHGQAVGVEGRPYVNIAPNDHVR